MLIHPIDLTIIIIYLVGITAVGLLVSRQQTATSAGYFLAGRSLGWVTVGLALFATNISTVHLIGLASAGYGDGMVVGNFEWMAAGCLILLGLVFAPFYFRSKVSTLPEYLERRYGPGARTFLAFMAVVGALFIHIGVTLYAGAVLLQSFVQIDILHSILIISLLTVIYTALGGLKAVVITESIQTVLLLTGALAVTLFGLARLADEGVTSLSDLHSRVLVRQAEDATGAAASMLQTAAGLREVERLKQTGDEEAALQHLTALAARLRGARTFGAVTAALDSREELVAAMTLATGDAGREPEAGTPPRTLPGELLPAARDLDEAAARQDQDARALTAEQAGAKPHSSKLGMIRTDGRFAWWIMLLGYPVIGIWYWCSDQTIVQRVLGARTERDAQIGPIFAGFIKVLPVLLMVLPGVIGYVLFGDLIAENPDATLAVLIQELLPIGLQGLVIAGLLAALMSTVAGALNSTSTLVSIDIVKRLRPGTPDRTLVRIGQLTTVVVMAIAMLWSTQGDRFGGIFSGINSMIAVLAPPISVVFLWGIFWRRGTATAALVTLISGFLLGAAAFVADFPAFGYEFITQELGMPFMLQAWWLFVILSLVFVTVSLLTPRPDPARVGQYCWTSPLAVLKEGRLSGWSDPRILSVVLLLVMAVLYTIFA